MPTPSFTPLPPQAAYSAEEMKRRAASLYELMQRRRTVRQFSDRPVPRAVIDDCLRVAGTAPSGANLQPWHFVVVSDPKTKQQIRVEAEKEEREFYQHRAPQAWLDALAPLGTDEHKPYLEIAPYLIAVFAKSYGVGADGAKFKHYYAQESVGLATGLLIGAIHHVGLAGLVHTPSPMRFLNEILGRPEQERPFVLLVVGHPAEGAQVPAIERKALSAIATYL